MKLYFEIRVTGRGEFPFDMLRHSQCWPVGAADACALPVPYHDPGKRRTVHLGMIGNWAQSVACVERFKSFLWTAEITQEESL